MIATMHVVKYLKKLPRQGILMFSTSKTTLYAYGVSIWARSLIGRKSTLGYYILLGQSLISWKIKKQIVVAKLSVEA